MTQLMPDVRQGASGFPDVTSHIEFADAIAWRFHGGGPDAPDVRQVARLGLLKAARRFDPARGVPFRAFAEPTITGEIKRYFRDSCWLVRPPRSVQEARMRVLGVFPELMQQLGVEPSVKELAETLECNKDLVSEAMQCGALRKPAALEQLWDDTYEAFALARATAMEEEGFERVEDRLFLSAALATASRDERRLLYLRFVQELSQQQIAVELGVSQMQVSRLLKAALGRLRRLIAA